MLHLNLLNIVTLLTLKVVLGDHHTRLTKILTIFNSKFSRSILTETIIFLSQLSVDFPKKSLSTYSSAFWSCLYRWTKTNGQSHLNIVTLLTLKVVLGDHHTRLTKILTIFNSKLSGSILIETRIFLSQLFVDFKNKISLSTYSSAFGHVSITRLKLIKIKGLVEGLLDNLPELEEPCPICLLNKANKISRVPTTDVSKFAPGFMLSTLKNAKSVWIVNPGGDFETSVVGSLGILVALVKRQIDQGSSN